MAVDTATATIAFNATVLLTVLVGLFRLAFRLKIRIFWWEGMWAAVAMVGAVAFASATLIYFQTKSLQTARIACWISSCTFPSTIWSVRTGLLYSIVRVISPSTCLRNFTRVIGALFIIVWAVSIVLNIWWCVLNQKSALGRPACVFSHSIAIFQTIADSAGDATLVILSLRLLWRVKLPRRQRRMILSIFSSSAIMSMISLPRSVAQVAYDESTRYILSHLELISSLVVCNLLVVVTYIYRVYLSSLDSGSESSSEDDDFTTPRPRSTQFLTTVDLNASDPTATGATNYSRSSALPSLIRSVAS